MPLKKAAVSYNEQLLPKPVKFRELLATAAHIHKRLGSLLRVCRNLEQERRSGITHKSYCPVIIGNSEVVDMKGVFWEDCRFIRFHAQLRNRIGNEPVRAPKAAYVGRRLSQAAALPLNLSSYLRELTRPLNNG